MSFAYKTLNPSDITISPYTANKLYTFASSSLTEYGIVVYSGEYEPIINVSCSDGPAEGQVPCNPYNPENDVTSNGYARRLIYDSIQKLYYQSFISGGFSNVLWTSSSYENYLQTALTSGSNYLTNVRVFGQDSGSGGSVYDGGIYESGNYPSDPSLIRVISIPQDIFGSGIKPGTFEISSSNYLIQDDGQGNLMDNKAITSSLYEGSPYTSNVYGGNTNRQGIHVGNIIYSHGMVIVTNEDYFCFYPSEPVAQNNSYVLLNVQPTKSLAVLSNDFDNCNELNTGSLSIVTPLPGYSFPDNSPISGAIRINPIAVNNLQVTPGLYKGTYFVSNSAGVPSNYATVSLELYASPLQLNVLSYTTGCYAASTTQSITFAINYGVPPYTYYLSGSNPTSSLSLYQPTQSITASVVSSSRSVTLYAEDSVGDIVSQSLTLMSSNIFVSYSISSPITCSGGMGTITVWTASSDLPVSVSINDGSINPWITSYPHTFTTSSGQHFLEAKNTSGCYIYPNAISIPLDEPQPITASLSILQGDCTDPSVGNVGALSVNVNGGVPPYSYTWSFNGSPLSPPQNTATPVGLQTGSYYVIVSDIAGGCNNGTSLPVNVTGTNSITFTTSSTAVGCYGTSTGQINLIFAGGLSSVTGSIYSGSTLITSSSAPSAGPSANITATGLSSGSNYSIRLVDTRGCTISQSVTVGSPAAPFNADLNATGALYIYKPSLYAPYTAQFKLHGGNYSTYHVTLSAILPGGSSYVDVASGSFSGNAGTSSLSMPVSGACLYDSSSWIISANDALSCSLANSSSQAIYVLPTQVISSLVQYVPTGSTPPFNNPTASCTASAVSLYFTASETSIGWSDMVIGDHVWENCNLTTSASGYGYWDFESVPIVNGIYNPDDIHTLCTTIISPKNRLYCWILNSAFFGTSEVSDFFTSTYYNIITNNVVTQSYASLSGYGDSGISSNYVQWTGSSTSFNVYDSPVSTMLATATPNFSMPFGIGVSLFSAPKGTSPTEIITTGNVVVSGYFLPPNTFCYDDNYQYNFSGVTYLGNQLFPQNVPLNPSLDYLLVPSFQTHDNSTICTFV